MAKRSTSYRPSSLRSLLKWTRGTSMMSSPPSRSQSHPRTAMTAWAHWSWTSGRTSPSSRTRPASESEQPSATTRLSVAAVLPGWLLKGTLFCLLVCVPFPVPSLPYPVSSSVLAQTRRSWQRLQLPLCPQMSAGNMPEDGLLGGWREAINDHQPPRG